MLKIQVAYEGEQKTRVTDLFTGTTLFTDAQRKEKFHPLDLGIISLGTSIMTLLIKKASDQGIRLSNINGNITFEMQREPIYRIKTISLHYTIEDKISEDIKKMLKNIDFKSDIIMKALHPEINVNITVA